MRKELEENPLLEEVPAETRRRRPPDRRPPPPSPDAPTAPDAAGAGVRRRRPRSTSERADDLPFDLTSAIFDDHGDERTPVSTEEREDLPFENLGRTRHLARPST